MYTVSPSKEKSVAAWRKRGWWTGFRTTTGVSLAAAVAVFIANIALLATSLTKPDSGVGTRILFQGDCHDVGVRSILAHLAINILGTLLLASSNAAMQALSAPTREDLNIAHAAGRWLDVGVSSLRNFGAMSLSRRLAWLALLFSSVPLHLLYNSVIIQSTSASEYYAVLATQDFARGAPINTEAYNGTTVTQGATNLTILHQIQNESASYANISLEDCLQTYRGSFVNGHTNVILVSNVIDWESSHTNSSALFSVFYSPDVTTLAYSLFDYTSRFEDNDGYALMPYLLSNGSILYDEGWQLDTDTDSPEQTFKWIHVDYCLSKEVEEVCALELHPVFLAVVLVANLFKILCFSWLLVGVFPLYPLLTTGDAIASFLNHPDYYTEGGFALSKYKEYIRGPRGDVSLRMLRQLRESGHLLPASRQRWHNGSRPWSASKAGWQRGVIVFLTMAWLILGLVALIDSYQSNTNNSIQPTVSLAQLWANGFGNVYPSDILSYTLQWSISANILLANAPQLLVSVIYVCYNQTFTQMHAAYETMLFASKSRGLRVSYAPRGAQRSSYWLSLPLHYAFPLMGLSAALHWALSQSLFLAEIVIQRADGSVKPPSSRINAVGYSLVGLLIILLLGTLMLIFIIVYGRVRRLPAGMPILGSCSLAIAAACHGHSDRPEEATHALRYGVVKITGEKSGRVGFSSEDVEPMQNGWSYDGDDSAPLDREADIKGVPAASRPLLAKTS